MSKSERKGWQCSWIAKPEQTGIVEPGQLHRGSLTNADVRATYWTFDEFRQLLGLSRAQLQCEIDTGTIAKPVSPGRRGRQEVFPKWQYRRVVDQQDSAGVAA